MKKIATIVGTRPQLIKAATFSRYLRHHKTELMETLVHTGQHYDADMSDVFFDQLGLSRPDYNLEVSGGGHGEQTGKMMQRLEEVLLKEKPDMVLVYGDTNSTLAGALVASKMHIPVAHVEAGLRSNNRQMPEEINRIVTDCISDILFTPSESAVKTLLNEGKSKESVFNVGDIMYEEALYLASSKTSPKVLEEQNLKEKQFFLATIHRAENTNDVQRLQSIFEALAEISKNYPVVLPLHPRTRKILDENGLLSSLSTQNLILIQPVGYQEMAVLTSSAICVLTDSGGLQKEAYFHQTPCVTMRDETEWTELVESSVNILTGANKEKILKAVKKQIHDNHKWPKNIYGDGQTSEKIVLHIKDFLDT